MLTVINESRFDPEEITAGLFSIPLIKAFVKCNIETAGEFIQINNYLFLMLLKARLIFLFIF